MRRSRFGIQGFGQVRNRPKNFHPDEDLTPTSYEKILLAQSRSLDETHFESELHMLRESVERYDHERARQIAIGLVPEYREGEESSTAESPNQAA